MYNNIKTQKSTEKIITSYFLGLSVIQFFWINHL